MNLEPANRIVAAALAKGREMDLPPLGVAVLDAGGHLVALQREDGLSFLRVQVCQAKAYGALGMGASTRHLATRAERGDRERSFLVALNGLADGRVPTVAGGVLVRDAGGALLGSVGISGASSEEDEACAAAGIEAAGLVADLESTR